MCHCPCEQWGEQGALELMTQTPGQEQLVAAQGKLCVSSTARVPARAPDSLRAGLSPVQC